MPRTASDRPKVVPDGCTNLALMGQFVEVPGDVVFTIETSVRTPLQAVYQLTGLDKEVIEVNPAQFDMRYFVERIKKFLGTSQIKLNNLPRISPFKLKLVISKLLERINGMEPYYVMYQGRDKSVAKKQSVLNPQYPKDR